MEVSTMKHINRLLFLLLICFVPLSGGEKKKALVEFNTGTD